MDHDQKKADVVGEAASVHSKNDIERVVVTDEDNKRIRKKTDKVILVILTWVYFLQILDKSVIGYSSVFGLREDTGMTGDQYSVLGSSGYYGQMAIQPISAFCLVKVPVRILMPFVLFGWGVSLTCMAAAHNFGGLIATRTLLGIFEAVCLPLFTLVTMTFYRRFEQPMRIATFYSTNGIATILGSALAFALGHIHGSLHSYQIIFLFTGLVTVLTVPFIYWKYDNSPGVARFLSPEDRIKGVERLRANQQGVNTTHFDIWQVVELFLEPKTYLWIGMTLLVNAGASVTNVFGPIIIKGFGFDSYTTSLLNMPFGAVQWIVVMISSYAAFKYRIKSVVLLIITIPIIAGIAVLYALGHSKSEQGPLLVGYYLMGFLFGGNPLLISWMAANTAGNTKKSALMSLYNASSAAGNIIGPLLFKGSDAPYYKNGLRVVLGFFVAMAGCVVIQTALLMFLNKVHSRKRVKLGKPAKFLDLSMKEHLSADDRMEGEVGDAENQESKHHVGENFSKDITDVKNEDFVYVY